MRVTKRSRTFWFIAAMAVVIVAAGGTLVAETQGLRAYADGPVAEMTSELPPVARGPMTTTPDATRAVSVLSFDDGTCESGLGAGITATALVDFDVPTQCTQAGLDVVGLTTRQNTGTANNFAFGQAGATPPAAGAPTMIAITPITAMGPCPATTMTTRAIGPGAAVVTGTSNFFAGIQNNGFPGRDTNGPNAGRMWFNCPTCGNTQYSPTTLSGLGLGGNWMIRVSVEDANCIPVELMVFSVE